MSNNSSDVCLPYQTGAKEIIFFIAYKIVTPAHFFLGLFGNILCLIAYCQRAKKQRAYMYQIFLTINETCEIAFQALAIAICAFWSGRLAPGQNWFLSSYACMWFAGHVIVPILNSFMTSSSLLSLAMALDRVYACTKGLAYKNANHKMNQTIAAVTVMSVSILTSLVDIPRFNVVSDEYEPGLYKLVTNPWYVGSMTATILAHVRNITRAVTAIALIVCNVVLVYSYRKRLNKVGQMTKNKEKEMQRKKDEKMLTYLAIFQSASSTFATMATIYHYCAHYITLEWFKCTIDFTGPATDAIVELCSVIDFYILVAISKNFREIAAEGLQAIRKRVCVRTAASNSQQPQIF